jgi:Bacterial Ig-like domain (group 3)/FG-GAP-like repeat/Beta-propeller repeat/Divergent InlB B-repeat domain
MSKPLCSAGWLFFCVALSAKEAPVAKNFANLPLAFEKLDNGFAARGQGYFIGLDADRAAAQVRVSKTSQRLSLEFIGSHRSRAIAGLELPGKVNYIRGNDPQTWRIGLPTWARVSYPDTYPGIDLVYYGNQQQIEFDLVVKPGGDPSSIRMKIGGGGPLAIDASGGLSIGELKIALPRIYQEINGAKKAVAGRFVLRGGNEVAFSVEPYDRSRSLVIDPTIVYSTLLGGTTGPTQGEGVAVDSSGNMYVAGYTYAADFPTFNAYQGGTATTTQPGGQNGFVTAINAAGTAFIYSTYIGGDDIDQFQAIAVDSAGSAWVAGNTWSQNFPVLNSAQTASAAGVVVLKLNSSGALVFSTVLGGEYNTQAKGVGVDGSGNAYVTGYSASGGLGTTAGVFQSTNQGGQDAFVLKFSSTGSKLYATLLGGAGNDVGYGIAADSNGNAYVTGATTSATIPGAPAGGAQTTNAGGGDAFVAMVNPTGTALVYFTFFGGASIDQANAIAVDTKGNAYIGGYTASAGLATSGVAQTSLAGSLDGFIAKLNATGTKFTYVTYLGGSRQDRVNGLAIDGSGNVYVAGQTESPNLPVQSALEPAIPGGGTTLFQTTNSGASWSAFDTNIPGAVFEVSADPTSSGTIVAVTEQGIYRTTDNGASWTQQVAGVFAAAALSRSPASSSTLYAVAAEPAAEFAGIVYLSTDGGVSWSLQGVFLSPTYPPSNGFGIVADPLTAETAYAFSFSNPSSVQKTADGGKSWVAASAGVPNPVSITSMTAGADGSLYIADYGSGIYKSTDQGGTWVELGLELPALDLQHSLSVTTTNPPVLYMAGGALGAYKGTNGGIYWNPVSATPGYAGQNDVTALAVSPLNSSVLYASDGYPYVSSNGGTTWTYAGTGLPDVGIVEYAFDPLNAEHVFAVAGASTAGFAAKLNNAGTAFTWSTYLGGAGISTQALGVATDGVGDAFVTGTTADAFVTSTAPVSLPGIVSAMPSPVNYSGAFVTEISDATAPCAYTVGPAKQVANGSGQWVLFSVVAPSGCAWTASSDQAWAAIPFGAAGTGTATVYVQIAANSTGASRSANLTIGGHAVTLTQADSSCSYSLNPGNINPPPVGGPVSVYLTTGAGCPWTVTNDSEAVTITSGASGTGSGTIALTVTPNLGVSYRQINLPVGNTVLSIFQVFEVSQNITFAPLSNEPFNAAPFALTGYASSQMPVTYVSNTPAVCTVSGAIVTLVAEGTCSITASQAGNGSIGPASPVTRTFMVTGEIQTITFGPLAHQTLGLPVPPLSATVNSPLAVSFTSNTPLVCTVSGVTITLLTTGTCSITASQAGNATFAPAANVTETFTVGMPIHAIVLASSANPSVFGQSVTLTATITPSAATGKVTFYDGTAVLGTAKVSSGVATLATIGIGWGQRLLTARYLGDSNYSAAMSPPITENITTKPGGSFVLANSISLSGAQEQALAVADLNHDGHPDIVAGVFNGNFAAAKTILVLINNGDGTFRAPVGYSVGDPYVTQIAIADIDLDGNPDIIASGEDGVYELKGNGDGTLQSASSLLSVAYEAFSEPVVRIADVNSDGYPDLIVRDVASAATFHVLLGNGDGTFQPAITGASSSAGPIQYLEVGDFNGDGIPDAAVSSTFGTIAVFLGAGDGTFVQSAVYEMYASPITIADVNKDGHPDIVGGAGLQNVLLGNGDGTFRRPTATALDAPLATGTNSWAAVTDVNGDGEADIVSTYGGFYPGNGDGTFRSPQSGNCGTGSGPAALGDFNGDGIVDIALGNYSGPSTIYICSAVLSPVLTLTGGPNPANVGQNVVLTVKSSFADATGTISFTDTSIGARIGIVTLSNGSATFTAPEPAQGTHIYQASYSGDSKYAAATTASISVTVQAPIGISLVASPNPAQPGEPVTLTATLSIFPGNANVIFLDGVTPLGYKEFYGGPNSSLSTTLAAGVHQLRAVFPEYFGYESTSASYTETVSAVGGGQLTADGSYLIGTAPTSLAAADFTGDGLTDVAVASAAGQSITLFSGTGLGKFQPAGSTALSFIPGAMVTVQLQANYPNGLAITNPAGNTVQAFIYSGGSFLPTTTYSVGFQPVAISTADFDGDGIPDLITANAGSNDVTLLLSSQGTLPLPVGKHPDSVVTGDFNNDGRADFAAANRDDNTVTVYLGNGDGTFRTAITTPAGAGPASLASGDLNGDGKTDLAVVDGGSGQITVLTGNGDGTFNALPAFAAPGASSITLVEFTASGFLDIAATSSSGLLVFTGHGNGTFSAPATIPQTAGVTAAITGTFVLDGRMDLAVVSAATNSVDLILNLAPTSATLSVSPPQGVTGGKVTLKVAVTPVSSAGWVTWYDGVTLVGSGAMVNGLASITTSLLLPGTHRLWARFDGIGAAPSSTAALTYTVTSVPSLGLAPQTQNMTYSPPNLVPGDFNNDGIEDFALTGPSGGLILLGNGDGTFKEVGGAGGSAPAVAADFNRDGFTDLAYSAPVPLAALGNGAGHFLQPTSTINVPVIAPTALAAADVNGDTIPDLVLANPNGTVDVLIGIGDGTFQVPLVFGAGENPIALAITDLNGDGVPDIVVADNISSTSGAINVLLGRGGGAFADPQTTLVGPTPVSIATGDFNGDHHTDLALAQSGSNIITLLPGMGDGTFGPPATITLPSSPVKILAADMNADGITDLIVLFTSGSPAFAILSGNGDGSFQPPVTYQDARTPTDFAVGDVNNDGRMDVVVASTSASPAGQGVDVFLGTGAALSVVQGSPQSAVVGSVFSNRFEVHTTPGQTVTFSAPASGPSGTFAGSVTSVNVTANASGNAQAPVFTANSIAGAYTVTASATAYFAANFNLTNNPGPPASVGPASQSSGLSAAVGTAFGSPLQALVQDAEGNPVPNVTVTFAAPASGASATFPGGGSSATGVTNASGIATSPVPAANGTAGGYLVSASVGALVAPDAFSLTNLPLGQIVVTSFVSPPGVPFGWAMTFAVDGVTYSSSHVFNWKPGDKHTLSVSSPQSTASEQFVFTGWSDGGAATHVFTVPAGAATVTANFKVQYSFTAYQGAGGTVTPAGGFFDAGSPITVTATPDSGYAFLSFQGSGSINSATILETNPLTFDINTTSSIYASFSPLSQLVSATVSHTGNFLPGQTGAAYSIVVSNGVYAVYTSGVTITEFIPPGLTLVSMAGAGWNCAANVCSRSDALAPGASFPTIAVTVDVALNAASLVINKVTTAGSVGTVATLDPTAIGYNRAQTIIFGPLSNVIAGVAPFTISATSSSGLGVSFTSTTPAVCTISGSTVTILEVGMCSITATQAGNTTYAAATPVTQTFTVAGKPQTITFGALSGQTLGVTPFALSATATSGLAVTFTSNSTGVCTVSGVEVTLLTDGTCSITASQAGNSTYAPATSVTQTFVVAGKPQTITFGTLGTRVLGATPFNLSASASSGLAVTFASNSAAVCKVSGVTVTLSAEGICSIKASQAGNSTYAPAAPVTQTFTVLGTITWGPLSDQTLGTAPFTLPGATSITGSAVTFASNSPLVCTVKGATVTLVSAGLCSITASQTGATSNTQTFTVFGLAQTISFGPLNTQTLSSKPPALSATASSGLGVTLTSNSPKICTVSGVNVTLVAAGSCSITASQPGNSTWAAAIPVTRIFLVSAGPVAAVSVSPSAGAGKSVTFQAVYFDSNGAGQLSELLLQINTGQSSANACYVYYQPSGKHLYLATNAGTAWITPALTPGVAGTASNSQCTLNAGSSSVTTAGDNLTLSVALTFSNTVAGTQNIYLYAGGPSGQASGWVKAGTWTPNPIASPPAIVSLSPNSGTGTSVTFKAIYSDPNGAADLSTLLLQVNASQSSANACYVYYQPQGNYLYLANNTGGWITPGLTPGVGGTVSNSQCTLNAESSSVSFVGNQLTLNLSLSFSGTFAGAKNLYLYAAGFSGQNSGWVKAGGWTP